MNTNPYIDKAPRYTAHSSLEKTYKEPFQIRKLLLKVLGSFENYTDVLNERSSKKFHPAQK